MSTTVTLTREEALCDLAGRLTLLVEEETRNKAAQAIVTWLLTGKNEVRRSLLVMRPAYILYLSDVPGTRGMIIRATEHRGIGDIEVAQIGDVKIVISP